MKSVAKTKKRFLIAIIAVAVCCLVAGCGKAKTTYNSLEELDSKKIAVETGSFYENAAKDYLPSPNIQYYASSADCFYAVNEGKADALVVSENYYNSALDKFPNMKNLGVLCNNDLYYATSKTAFGALVCSDLSEYLKKEWESGRQQELLDQWKNGEKEAVAMDLASLSGEKGIIHAAVEPLDLPYTCYIGDGYAGIEAENLYNFCKEYNI